LRELAASGTTGKISVAQEHFSTAATQYIMATFYDRLFSKPLPTAKPCSRLRPGRAARGRPADGGGHPPFRGLDTVYLGANLPIPDLTAEVERLKPDVLALSATIAKTCRG
jgi:methanogenic corrinoid protein MtbC1